MNIEWGVINDFLIMSVLLLIASGIVRSIPVFRKIAVPANIIAGVIFLILGPEVLELVDVSYKRFGTYVYHLLPLIFIAMGLGSAAQNKKSSIQNKKSSIVSSGVILSIGYGTQAVIGLLVVQLYSMVSSSELFPNFGYMLMLGFGQGPGQAYSLGSTWENAGFANGGSLGLTFAAFGYLWAAIPGVLIVSWFNNKSKTEKNEYFAEQSKVVVNDNSNLTHQVAWVAFVYFITYSLLKFIDINFLTQKTKLIMQLKGTLWGVHFIIAALLSIATKKILTRFKKSELINNDSMTKLSGVFLDFMVVAAIAAISLKVLREYLTIIILMTSIGGIAMIGLVYLLIQKSKLDYPLGRFAVLFGTLTGTLSTGLTLNRMVDPEFKTSAAQDVVMGAGISVPLTIPIFATFLIPLFGQGQSDPNFYYWINILIIAAYTMALYISWRVFVVKKSVVTS
jgi:glutamate:Na+ symporter, ESS family